MHFATAAVLLMRMYGIPARYATGFAISAADFDWQDGAGWLANVEDSRSHAWAEIYYEGAWHGFDPTRDCRTDASYLRFATGRDAADCPVEQGTFLRPCGPDADRFLCA